MHGGAKGSGAAKNNQNALKHGGYTRDVLQHRAAARALIAEARKLVEENQ
jgi:hypothetical protein